MFNVIRAAWFALSLKNNLLQKGEVVVEFDSTKLADATMAMLNMVAPFKFSYKLTKKGYYRLWKLEPIW